MPGVPDRSLARYYDWLSWYERLAAPMRRRAAKGAPTVHRRLTPEAAGMAPADVVHERILAALGPIGTPRVIDAGCGNGATTLYLHARIGGRYDGLTLSPVQRVRAEREAQRVHADRHCRFHLRSYDADLSDLVPGGADLVVAIESLAHSPAPARTLANLAACLCKAGRLAIVDDMPADRLSDDDPDLAGFRAGWNCPAIARRRALVAALSAAGLSIERDEDLTGRVMQRRPAMLDGLIRANALGRRVLGRTGAAQLLASFHGGLMLERLYRRGLMEYRLLVARRP
jgi:SAM-dependent methyltransferase